MDSLRERGENWEEQATRYCSLGRWIACGLSYGAVLRLLLQSFLFLQLSVCAQVTPVSPISQV